MRQYLENIPGKKLIGTHLVSERPESRFRTIHGRSRCSLYKKTSSTQSAVLSFDTVCEYHRRTVLPPARPTQPPTLIGMGNEYRPKCVDALRLWSKGRHGSFHLWMRVWVAGKAVWSLVNTCHT